MPLIDASLQCDAAGKTVAGNVPGISKMLGCHLRAPNDLQFLHADRLQRVDTFSPGDEAAICGAAPTG